MNDSRISGEVLYNASVRTRAATHLERVRERERYWKQARDLIPDILLYGTAPV